MNLFIVFLNVQRQCLKEVAAHIQHGWTSIVRAHYFLKIFYLKDDIMVQARFTKMVFMLTFAHGYLIMMPHFTFFDLSFAYVAVSNVPEVVYSMAHSASN